MGDALAGSGDNLRCPSRAGSHCGQVGRGAPDTAALKYAEFTVYEIRIDPDLNSFQ